MQKDIQQAVEQVLAIEREADAITRRGEEEAQAIRARAAQAANAVREEVLAKARREADEAVASARAQAELERDQRLAETTREIEGLERSARREQQAAVRFVLANLLGGDVAEAIGPTPRKRRAA